MTYLLVEQPVYLNVKDLLVPEIVGALVSVVFKLHFNCHDCVVVHAV